MRFLPLLAIVMPFAAMAQDAPPRPLAGAFPSRPLDAALPPQHAVLQRLFIAPSGEAFRAPMDAPYPLATWFAQADHNHDGRVDLTEFTWDFDRFFDSLDTDHDGTLRSDEIERYEKLVPELHSGFAADGPRGGGSRGGGGRHRGGHGGGGHGGGGMGGGGMGGSGGGSGGGFGGVGGAGGYHGDEAAADQGTPQDGQEQEQSSDDTPHAPPAYVPSGSATRYELISIPEPVSAMDTDLSGTVTREELHHAAARRFAILDQKQRGYITLEDLPEPDAARHKDAPRRRS